MATTTTIPRGDRWPRAVAWEQFGTTGAEVWIMERGTWRDADWSVKCAHRSEADGSWVRSGEVPWQFPRQAMAFGLREGWYDPDQYLADVIGLLRAYREFVGAEVVSEPLICERCGKEILPGTDVEMLGMSDKDLEDKRIFVGEEMIVVHAACPEEAGDG